MEVLDLIYHHFSFTANILGQQPTTSQFFQPLTPQTLALVAAAIHCALSEYATGKKGTVMFSQDEYRSIFCPATVTDSSSALLSIDGQLPYIGPPQSLSALLGLHLRPSISFCVTISTPLDHFT
jgi:hypothetical protein